MGKNFSLGKNDGINGGKLAKLLFIVGVVIIFGVLVTGILLRFVFSCIAAAPISPDWVSLCYSFVVQKNKLRQQRVRKQLARARIH
jgi:cytochrome b subunit of formate dehydrogenase